MAEGWAHQLKSDVIEAYSAGVDPHGMNAFAMRVMAEANADISKQRSKHVDELQDLHFDYVVTVCDNARDSCPRFVPRKVAPPSAAVQTTPTIDASAAASLTPAECKVPTLDSDTVVLHVPFDDPPRLAKAAQSESEILDCYRRVRDEIKEFVAHMPDNLTRAKHT